MRPTVFCFFFFLFLHHLFLREDDTHMSSSKGQRHFRLLFTSKSPRIPHPADPCRCRHSPADSSFIFSLVAFSLHSIRTLS